MFKMKRCKMVVAINLFYLLGFPNLVKLEEADWGVRPSTFMKPNLTVLDHHKHGMKSEHHNFSKIEPNQSSLKQTETIFEFLNKNPTSSPQKSKRQVHYVNPQFSQFPAARQSPAHYQNYPPTAYNSVAASQYPAYQYSAPINYAPFNSPVQYQPAQSYADPVNQPFFNSPSRQNPASQFPSHLTPATQFSAQFTTQQAINRGQLNPTAFALPPQYAPQSYPAAPNPAAQNLQLSRSPLNQNLAAVNHLRFSPPIQNRPSPNAVPVNYATYNFPVQNPAPLYPTISENRVHVNPTFSRNPAQLNPALPQNRADIIPAPVTNLPRFNPAPSPQNRVDFHSTNLNQSPVPSSSPYRPVQWNSALNQSPQLSRRTDEDVIPIPSYPYGGSDAYQKYLILPSPPTEFYENNHFSSNPTHINNNLNANAHYHEHDEKDTQSIPILAPMAEIVEPEPWDSEERISNGVPELYNPMDHVHWTPEVVRHRVLRPILYGTVAGLSLFAGYSAFVHAVAGSSKKRKRVPATEVLPAGAPPPADIHQQQMQKIENFIASQQSRRRA